jgi:putative ABC transport system permease protein
MRTPDPFLLRLCLALLRVFGPIVPRPWRHNWRREWEAEIRHRHESLDERDLAAHVDLVSRACGALPDAAWLRRQFTADAEVFHDIRHGARMLRKSPTFTLSVVFILALGIGGTVAIAAFLDTLIFRPLPYADADRIVTVWQRPQTGAREDVAPANFLDWRVRSQSFERLVAVIPYSYDYSGVDEPEVFFGAQVTEGFFEAMGIRPALGRVFLPEEHVRGGRPVAIISHAVWQRRFGGDPSIVNRTITLDDDPKIVVGVLPPDFNPQLLPRPTELSVWTPKVIQEHEPRVRGSAWWNVVGRLKPGVSVEAAQAEMTSIAAALGKTYPKTNAQSGIEVVTLRDHLMGPVKLPLFVMLGAVVLVLVIGCANVASLMLARGMHREREFAIRSALGAGRARLVRQLVVESVMLSGVSAVAGLGLAYWLMGMVIALAPARVVRLQEAAIDSRIMVFAGALALVTAIAFGILPAIQFSRPGSDAMRERSSSSPRARFRRTLVAAEVALAVVLLTAAGLLLRSFDRLLAVDPGFSARNVVALQVFAYDRNTTPDKLRTFFGTTLDRLRQLPGVEAVGAASAMPFAVANLDIKSGFEVVGREQQPAAEQKQVYVTIATAGYFRAMSIPLREGRFLEDADGVKAARVALVSDALRRREFPGESPVGKRIRVHFEGKPLEAEIVGVVSPIRHDGLDSAPRAEVFLPHEQAPFAGMTFVIRSRAEPSSLIAAAKQAVWSVDPLQTFYETGRLETMIASSVVRQRFSTVLVSAFAGMALLLCAIGVYGVISFATAQRTREIGVRMALGADRGMIRRMVLREGGAIVVGGLIAGLLVSAATTRYLTALLFEIKAIDPLTMGVVCVTLAFVALVACYVPARRATRVDPVVALRVE